MLVPVAEEEEEDCEVDVGVAAVEEKWAFICERFEPPAAADVAMVWAAADDDEDDEDDDEEEDGVELLLLLWELELLLLFGWDFSRLRPS